MFTQVAEDLQSVPHMEQIRRRLLEDGLEFYQGFLNENSTDPDVRHETARAYMRVGSIQLELGQLEQVSKPLNEAIKLLEKLSAEFPSVPEYRSDLASSHASFSTVLADHLLNRPDESLEQALAALDIKRKLAAEFPNRPEFRRDVAGYLTIVAIRFSRCVRRPAESEVYFREALETWEAIQKESPNDPTVLPEIASARFWLSLMYLDTKRLPEAEADIRAAMAVFEEQLARSPNDLGLRSNMAYMKTSLGSLLRYTGRGVEAEPLIREAIAHREKMLDDFPNSYDTWRRLGIEYRLLSDCQLAMGRMEEAEESIRSCLSLWQKVKEEFTSENQTSYDLARSYYALGLLLYATDRPQDASDAFRQAFGITERITSGAPILHFTKICSYGRSPPALPLSSAMPSAVKLAKQSLQRQPGLWNNWHLLGVAQYRAGRSGWSGRVAGKMHCPL